MKRKVSSVPTVVFEYRLWAPTAGADLVEKAFADSDDYYDELAEIENDRRSTYRRDRRELFPALAALEDQEAELDRRLAELGKRVRAAKADSRSRSVDDSAKAEAKDLRAKLKEVRARVREAKEPVRAAGLRRSLATAVSRRDEVAARAGELRRQEESADTRSAEEQAEARRVLLWYERKLSSLDARVARLREEVAGLPATSPDEAGTLAAQELVRRAEVKDAEALAAAKAARKRCYWGTGQLVEAAVERAMADSPGYVAKKIRGQGGRIGIQVMGGLSPEEALADTRIQLDARERRKDGVFRLRVGTVPGTRAPVWSEWPIRVHRPLPSDAVVKWAVVTRTRGHMLRPWVYHLCLSVESQEHFRALPGTRQEGTTAVNFGWRKVGDTVRVATLNNDARAPEHVLLPALVYRRFGKCAELRSLVDEQFNAAKATLASFIAGREGTLPEAFVESFAGLAKWRSADRLSGLVEYWRDHRVAGDEDVFAALWHWRGRWWHLHQWEVCNYRKALRARMDFYRCLAKRVCEASARVVVEDFCITQVVRRASLPAEVELEGGDAARENRVRAAVSELRTCLLHAAARYHSEVVLVRATNNTRRCNVCGKLVEWDPARELVRSCPDCSTWDQDVNATDNALDRAASGEAATLVRPAEVSGSRGVVGPVVASARAARGQIPSAPGS